MTNAQPYGAGEQVLSALPGKMAPQSSSLAGGFEGIATAKPPLVKENTIRLPKSKSLTQQGALEPTKDAQKAKDLTNPMQETPTNRNEGARTG